MLYLLDQAAQIIVTIQPDK